MKRYSYTLSKKMEMKPFNLSKNFKPFTFFKDSDRDNAPDIFDCKPFNPRRQDNKNKNLNGLYIKKMEEGNYAVMHRGSRYPLGYGRKTKEKAIKDIPSLLKFWGVKSASDPRLVKKLDEEMKKGIKSAKQREKHGNRNYRGYKRRAGELVLELGAGIQPDTRATHAIDLQNPQMKYKNLNYKHGYDLNKKALPYGNSSFHKIISYGSLGLNFGTQKTYKEVYRILKPGGILEIGIPKGYEKNIPTAISNIKKAGFTFVSKKVIKTPEGGVMIRILAKK